MPGETTSEQVDAPETVATTPPVFDVAQHVPEDVRTEKFWESFKGKTLHDVMKSAVNTHKMVGSSIQLPKPDDQDGWSKVYDKLGRPKEPKEYDWDVRVPGVDFDEEKLNGFKEAAHKSGVTKAQFKELMNYYNTSLGEQVKHLQDEDARQVAEVQVKMKNQYGPNYDYATAMGKRAIREIVKDEHAAEMIEQVFQRNEHVYKAFVEEGERMRSHGTIEGVTPFDFKGIDRDGAREKLNQIMAEGQAHPANNPQLPGHKEALEKMMALYNVAYPN